MDLSSVQRVNDSIQQSSWILSSVHFVLQLSVAHPFFIQHKFLFHSILKMKNNSKLNSIFVAQFTLFQILIKLYKKTPIIIFIDLWKALKIRFQLNMYIWIRFLHLQRNFATMQNRFKMKEKSNRWRVSSCNYAMFIDETT